MKNDSTKNIKRFLGFADTYENARPKMPNYPVKVIKNYLGKTPDKVLDLGCGTGLSTLIWQNECEEVIGIEPNEEMLSSAKTKQTKGVSFIKSFSHDIKIADNFADVIICSQSFHWMEPNRTLKEVDRILKEGGIFATVDYDWPPVFSWEAEAAYSELFSKVNFIEIENKKIKESFIRWDKNKHLSNIKNSGYFRYAREIVFANTEKCTADRFINMAKSQGGLQSILKVNAELINTDVDNFKEKIYEAFDDKEFDIDICYRMRIGVK